MNMRRKGIGIMMFIVFGLAALSWVVMTLWNYSLAPAVGVNNIDYWQAAGLLVLMRILIGGFRFGPRMHGGPPKWGKWREKWKNMDYEERQKLKQEWKKRCDPES